MLTFVVPSCCCDSHNLAPPSRRGFSLPCILSPGLPGEAVVNPMASDTGDSGPGTGQVDLTLVLGIAMFRRTAKFTFAIGVLAVITFSLIPKEALPETGIWDKLLHALAYGGLAVLGGLGFVGWQRKAPPRGRG